MEPLSGPRADGSGRDEAGRCALYTCAQHSVPEYSEVRCCESATSVEVVCSEQAAVGLRQRFAVDGRARARGP
eukprot:5917730-Alexandrium_andersonii.AAC.1